MPDITIASIPGSLITNAHLTTAAKLFSDHYGIWGPSHPDRSKHGTRIRMSASHLHRAILPSTLDDSSTYIHATSSSSSSSGETVAHVFACRCHHKGRAVLWVTQLVVHASFRHSGLATQLLGRLPRLDIWAYGIASSQPFACMALARAVGRGIEAVDLSFIREFARGVVKASPVGYVREGGLRGSLHDGGDEGVVSAVETRFWVDHAEPDEAVRVVRGAGRKWALGEVLPEGCEFLLLVEGLGDEGTGSEVS